jgi:nucleoside-diphosphate-sugar epimerase
MHDHSRPVLVTGGAGFAGSYVVRELLERGRSVVVYDLADYRAESRFVIGAGIGDVTLERGSIDDWARVVDVVLRRRPSAVVHAGGIMDTAMLDGNPSLALRTNVGGGVALLEASRLVGGVERFVCFSTIAVVGKMLYQPIDANHPCITATTGPLGAYSAAKAALEAFCFSYLQSFGLDIRIVRPSALYGFGMSWFAPNYMKNIVEPAVLGESVALATGGAVPRDYTSAADCASLVAAILDGPDSADRVYYAATGRELRTASQVGAIVRDLVPGANIEIGDAMTDVDREELAIRGTYSIENARSQLGWEPRFAELADGIADYIERFRAFLAAGHTPTPMPVGLTGAPGMAAP